MKKSIFTLIVLSVITLGLSSCCNRITLVETSYMVTHPALHKGDKLVFQGLPNVDTYVHFGTESDQHPCKETTIAVPKGKLADCKIREDPSTASFYLYIINTDPKDVDPRYIKMRALDSRKCPPWWCPAAVVVAPVSTSAEASQQSQKTQSDSPDVEILIYNAIGVPNPASAYPGQKVYWIKTGTNPPGSTVDFGHNNVCVELSPIKSGVCTVNPNAVPGPYTYIIDGNKGQPSELDVLAAPASTNPQ